ncbi:MAG: peptidase T [Treponema sp.]|nr:peptidase T [Treponema sp.]
MAYVTKDSDIQKALLDRFIKYVKIWTESDTSKADEGIMPSADREFDFAKQIAAELTVMGLQQVQTTKDCYTYAYLPASKGFENIPSFCLLAHIDTVEEVIGKDVKPIIYAAYDGTPIDLQCGVRHDPKNDSALALAAKNQETIITGDGTTLLGADDKAGVSEIMTCLEYLVSHPEVKHGKIEVLFSPDEETGHGMDKVPLDLVESKFAYTVDGGHIGELETECFNAYSAVVSFIGKSCHTGSARQGGMINAVSMAASFVQSIPVNQRPETTDGYEGFFAVLGIEGSVEKAIVTMILRDFTQDGMFERIEAVKKLAESAALSFGGKTEVSVKEQYKNMKPVMDKNPSVVKKLVEAYEAAGIEPKFVPIRGGTDGSRLTEMGIPCPNIFTGGHNFHGRYEWASLDQMSAATDVLINLAQKITEN